MNFLPENYQVPQTGGNYMKFEQGENKFRILDRPIVGWEDWKDNKPLRFKLDEKPQPVDANRSVKHFWAMPVWNYKAKKVQILEITQTTIQTAIKKFSQDDDYGSPLNYDIVVDRTGEGLETEYTIIPKPPKEAEADILEAYKKTPVNLEALFDGSDPFIPNDEPKVEDIPF